MFCFHMRKKKEWFGCERMKMDTANQEQSHKLYGKEAYEHSSRRFEIHLFEMMTYIARKEGIKRLAKFMNGIKKIDAKIVKNYCEPSQNSRSVQLINDSTNQKWKLPKEDEKGRASNLFHPLLNVKLLNTYLQPVIEEYKGKNMISKNHIL